jgi:hypothetical protein
VQELHLRARIITPAAVKVLYTYGSGEGSALVVVKDLVDFTLTS